MDKLQKLRETLRSVPAGPITDDQLYREIVRLLGECWEQMPGTHETAMRDFKLNRAEQVSWDYPVLSFILERHGGTVLGSTRAELQRWTVNLESGSVGQSVETFRQLTPTAPRLDVKPIVTRVCEAVRQGSGSDCKLTKSGIVSWPDENRVIIKQGVLIPDDGFRQTVADRRRRFRDALIKQMKAQGWELERVGRYLEFRRLAAKG